MVNVLFVFGIPDDTLGSVVIEPNGGLSVITMGSCNVNKFLPNLAGKRHAFCLDSRPGSQKYSMKFWPDIIFNEISDADSHVVALERCTGFCQQQGKPVINPASAILGTRRDLIAKNLADVDGLRMPKTIRVQPSAPGDVVTAVRDAQMNFPVIFRKAGDHGGISTCFIECEDDIEKAMHQYALDGRYFYVTEFVDFKSADDCYRKCRIVVVEGKPYLRHMIVSDDWLIHSKSREFMHRNPHYNEEEAALLNDFYTDIAPQISTTIKTITERIGLDYYGIDCNITDNTMIIFEINANMNILINNQGGTPNIWERPIERISDHLTDMIIRKAAV